MGRMWVMAILLAAPVAAQEWNSRDEDRAFDAAALHARLAGQTLVEVVPEIRTVS
ncbi:hypothetical protein [Thiosulfatihalobacter marinus]|uniref:hypothetical protein n=1 Tax=Thiosulfatihalobacter marinus TaxID=2792481 RepID=UPI0018DA2078|nr:hypothetical protein [Thiosulfatihalobacter marinus]